jgi:hypothetical protein
VDLVLSSAEKPPNAISFSPRIVLLKGAEIFVLPKQAYGRCDPDFDIALLSDINCVTL